MAKAVSSRYDPDEFQHVLTLASETLRDYRAGLARYKGCAVPAESNGTPLPLPCLAAAMGAVAEADEWRMDDATPRADISLRDERVLFEFRPPEGGRTYLLNPNDPHELVLIYQEQVRRFLGLGTKLVEREMFIPVSLQPLKPLQ